jgi:pyrroline-5-carboxylate reductase
MWEYRKNSSLVILGGGNMGGAFARAVERIPFFVSKEQSLHLYIVEPNEEQQNRCRKNFPKWKIVAQATDVLNPVALVILAVKPAHAISALASVGAQLDETGLVISCCAGISLASMTACISKVSSYSNERSFVRCMPNLGVQVGCGAIAYVGLSDNQKCPQMVFALNLLASMGCAIEVEEKHLDAVTALSGSGPGYFAYILEHLEKAGVALGLDEKVVRQLLIYSLLGTGELLRGLNVSPSTLREQVTTPQGTTAAALEVFSKYSLDIALVEGVRAAATRSNELGKL